VITDLCILEPEPGSRELVVTHIHPGVTEEQIREATGWDIRFANDVSETEPPNETELATLREFLARTARAHGDDA
jgi:glutaconate CoA-transferase subunit B